MIFQRRDQAVGDGSVYVQLCGQIGDGHPSRPHRDDVQRLQAAIQRLEGVSFGDAFGLHSVSGKYNSQFGNN